MAIALNLLMIVNYGIPSLVVDMVASNYQKSDVLIAQLHRYFEIPLWKHFFFFLHAGNYLLFWSGTVLKIAVTCIMLRCSCFDLRKGYQLVYKKMHLGSDHKPPWQRLTPLTLFLVFCKSDYLIYTTLWMIIDIMEAWKLTLIRWHSSLGKKKLASSSNFLNNSLYRKSALSLTRAPIYDYKV